MTWMFVPVRHRFSLVVLPALLAGCASLTTPPAPVRTEVVLAVTASMELLTFNAGQPAHILQRTPITGLPAGDALVGIDYRVARGVLYALSQAGRLYTLDARSGALQPVGAGASLALPQGAFGMDFNPTVDRIRVVGPGGLNLRLHPDTGAQVDGDAALHYAANDTHAGQRPDIVAAAYTYNTRNEQLTTNYAIDRRDERQELFVLLAVADPQYRVGRRLDQAEHPAQHVIGAIAHFQADQIGPVILVLGRRRQRRARHADQQALGRLGRIAIGQALQLDDQLLARSLAPHDPRRPPLLGSQPLTPDPPLRQLGPGQRVVGKRMDLDRTTQTVGTNDLAQHDDVGNRQRSARYGRV